MNVAMFTDAFFPRINGVAVSVNSYALELSRLGHNVCVVCPDYTEKQQKNTSYDEKKFDRGIPYKVIRVPSSSLPFSKEDRALRFTNKHFVSKQMDEFMPDIIHINSEFVAGFFGAKYALSRNIPYVYTFHTLWEDYFGNYLHFLPDSTLRKLGQRIVKYHLKRADVLIVPTKTIADVARRYGAKKELEILPTGITESDSNFLIPRSKIVYADLYNKFPDLRDKEILLFVGRITKEKNLLFLYDVLEKVKEKYPNIALLMVGGGPFLEKLQEIAKKRKLESSVFFPGYIQKSDVVYYYNLAKVFVFPSKTETQGLVTVEAMLAGIPTVAIEASGTIDIMYGNKGGFMVKEDADVFAQKVIELLTDENLWRQKSEDAYATSEALKISNLTPKLIDCYKKAAEIKKWKIEDEK